MQASPGINALSEHHKNRPGWRNPGITTKIFAIAASILLLLIAIAINTHSKIRIINEEVSELSDSILPITGRINAAIIATLKQEIHLERALRLLETQPPSNETSNLEVADVEIALFKRFGKTAEHQFSLALQEFDSLLEKQTTLAQHDVRQALLTLKNHNNEFHGHAVTLLEQLRNLP